MPSAAQAVDAPLKGMIVKNTFIDVEASDDEEAAAMHSRRGFLTMPAMPRESLVAEDQPSPEPSPTGVAEKTAAAEQPFGEPSPEGYPTLMSAMQRKAPAELPDRKVIVKNTFIDTQEEPDASPSPGHGRRVTCPVVLPSMEQGAVERLAAFGMKASEDDSDDERPSRHPSAGGSSSSHVEAAASSDDDAPRTRAQRWNCVQTEDLRDELAAAEARLQRPAGEADAGDQAAATAGGRRVSFPKEIATGDAEDGECETPRGPRRGGAWDTQDLRDALLEGSMPELEVGRSNQPGTPVRVPVSLFAAAVGTSPGPVPVFPPSPSAPLSPPQALQPPGPGSPQHGVPLSLSNAVPVGVACTGPAPLSPQAAAPTSPLVAATTSPASPSAAAAAQFAGPLPPSPGHGYGSPGAWPLLGPYGYPYAQQMPWAPQWNWCGMPAPERPIGGPDSPPASPPQREGPAGAAPRSRGERQQAGRHAQGSAPQAPAAEEAAPRQEPGVAPTAAPATTRNGRRLRLWAHIYLHMQVQGFDLVPRLIGRGGQNMRKIAEATNAKIRIRGRGSGHLEVDGGNGKKQEAPTPLMVAVTTDKGDEAGFRAAIELIIKELHATEQRYRSYIKKQQIPHEGPCYSVGLLPDEARQCLGALIDGIPTASTSKRSEA